MTRRTATMVATATSTTYKNFIGGEWRDAISSKTFEVENPATLETIATVPDAGPEDMKAAIEAAVAAQPAWAETAAAERSRLMTAAAARMHQDKERLARIMTLEEGKPLAESRTEIVYAASFIEWFAEEAKRVYGDTIP